MTEDKDHALIDSYVANQIRSKLDHEYVSLAHTFSLLKRDPQEAFENLFIIMFMAPLLVGRGDIARRNLLLLKGLVERFEGEEEKSSLATRIVEAFYEEFDSVIRKINKIQQVYSVDIDLSFLKDIGANE
jgi:hypothetical protein